MISKVKRKPKVVTTKLQTGDIFKLVGIPHKFNNGYIWITGMAVSKSTRALNDWMKRRSKRKNVIKLNTLPPKKRNYKTFWIAVNVIKKWIEEIPEGDSLTLRCEGVNSEQLFRIYTKWFEKHENIPWVISEKHRSFFFYNKRT